MAIPDYQTIMLPLLRFSEDGKVHSKHEAVEYLANWFELNQEERKDLLPSGKQGIFNCQAGRRFQNNLRIWERGTLAQKMPNIARGTK